MIYSLYMSGLNNKVIKSFTGTYFIIDIEITLNFILSLNYLLPSMLWIMKSTCLIIELCLETKNNNNQTKTKYHHSS